MSYTLLDRFGQFLLLVAANVVSQDLLDILFSFYVITWDNHVNLFQLLCFFLLAADTWLSLSLCRFRIPTRLFGHVNVIFAFLSLVLLLPHLLPALPTFHICLALIFFFILYSRSCLFHRALQSLRINKLYISLCIIPKAPFRKKTQLICPRASVYPKWLHQTWLWWETWPSLLVPHAPELIPIKSTFVFPIEQPGTDPRIRYGEQGEQIYGSDSQRCPHINFIMINVSQVGIADSFVFYF